MKNTRITFHLFVLLLSLVVFAFSTRSTIAHAAITGRTTVFKFNGMASSAIFNSLSSDGCIDTNVVIGGTQSDTGSSAYIFISQFDGCTQTEQMEANGSTFSPDILVNKKLDSASLSATIPVKNYITGNTFDVSVSMTWTATSPISRVNESYIYHTNDLMENIHFHNASRNASASGSVSDGTTNFSPSPTVFATIGLGRYGVVTIIHS